MFQDLQDNPVHLEDILLILSTFAVGLTPLAGGVVVRIRRLLGRARLFRHVP